MLIRNIKPDDADLISPNQIELIRVECMVHSHRGYGVSKRTLAYLNNTHCEDCSDESRVKVIWTCMNQENCEADTEYFRVHSATKPNIPTGIFRQFLNIKTFDMTYHNLTTVDANDFENAYNLHTLNLTGNNLSYFPFDILGTYTNIQEIDLSFNQFEDIHFEFFNVEMSLKRLYLDSNNLKSLPTGLTAMENLLLLSVTNNHIREVEFSSNAPAQLEYLYLDNNDLDIVDTTEISNLLELTVSNNPLTRGMTSVARKTVGSNTEQTTCELTSNMIEMTITNSKIIKIVVPLVSPSVKLLNLSTNALTSISEVAQLTSLTELDVSYNAITEINGGLFEQNDVLVKLILRGNLLKIFDFSCISNSKVQYLDISYNNIDELQVQMDNEIQSLEEIHLEGNNLTSFDTNLKISMPNLQSIAINDNDFECTQLRSDLLMLRIDKVRAVAGITESPMRTNHSSNVNGIGCYKPSDKIEERVTALEEKLDLLMKAVFSSQPTQSPTN